MLVPLLLARADVREPAHAGSSSGEKTAPPKGAAEVLSWSGIWREQEVEGEVQPARGRGQRLHLAMVGGRERLSRAGAAESQGAGIQDSSCGCPGQSVRAG